MYLAFAYLLRARQITLIDRVLIHHRVGDTRSLSAPTNTATDKFNRCIALDTLRDTLPAAIFQPLAAEYYAFYLKKSLDGILRSNFAQGRHIFAHTQNIFTDHMDTPFATTTPTQQQFLAALQTNDFVRFYLWAARHHRLLVTDPIVKPLRKIWHRGHPRILFLTNTVAGGGAEKVLTLWAEMLSQIGCQVTIMANYALPDEYPVAPQITRANLVDDYAAYVDECGVEKFQMLDRRQLLARYLTTHPQDLIIPFLTSPNLVAACCPTDYCHLTTQTIRNHPAQEKQGLELLLRDWAIQKQGSVILQNDEQRAYFQQPAFRRVKQYVVHNPLNPTIENLSKKDYRPLKKLVAVGRLAPQKNHALMIEAIRILRDEFHANYDLDIYGAGELHTVLQAQIDAAHLTNQVKLCGRTNDLLPKLVDYDLFLMTSLFEGTPNALLEAMGMGLPCLAVQCQTGVTELLDDGKNGYLLDSYDPHALAQKIYSLNQVNELERVGQQARVDMRRYRLDQIQAELVAVVADLLRHPPRALTMPRALKILARSMATQPSAMQAEYYGKFFQDVLYLIKHGGREQLTAPRAYRALGKIIAAMPSAMQPEYRTKFVRSISHLIKMEDPATARTIFYRARPLYAAALPNLPVEDQLKFCKRVLTLVEQSAFPTALQIFNDARPLFAAMLPNLPVEHQQKFCKRVLLLIEQSAPEIAQRWLGAAYPLLAQILPALPNPEQQQKFCKRILVTMEQSDHRTAFRLFRATRPLMTQIVPTLPIEAQFQLFKRSLAIIKQGPRDTAAAVFDFVRTTMHSAAFTPATNNQLIYQLCLTENNFPLLYQYFQTIAARN